MAGEEATVLVGEEETGRETGRCGALEWTVAACPQSSSAGGARKPQLPAAVYLLNKFVRRVLVDPIGHPICHQKRWFLFAVCLT